MNRMKIEIAAFLIIMITLCILILLSSCGCAHYPEMKDFPKGTSKTCIRYERCLYYSSVAKVKLDCSELADKCSKADVFLDYPEMKEANKLPDVYDKTGEHQMTFQEYWDKRQ